MNKIFENDLPVYTFENLCLEDKETKLKRSFIQTLFYCSNLC